MTRARLIVLAAALVAIASLAFAASGTDDRASAEATIADLEKNPHTKELCADPISKSRLALERARRMRVAGDDKHARLADGLAAEWARVARELARADEIETRAAAAREIAADAGAQVERERAMLEQQLAENGRLQAELAKIESARDAGPAAPLTVPASPATHNTSAIARDGGAR